MNFESWQAQQKAQKDEERKRKTQAAEALRSYKGEATNAEASKLAQLKEQDRQQKLEAERQLREYRGTISEEDTKLTNYKEEERRKKQEAANLLRGYQGTLSEEEAKLAAAREDERRKKQQAQEQLYRNLETTKGENNCSADEAIAPGSVSAMAGVFNGRSRRVYPMTSRAFYGFHVDNPQSPFFLFSTGAHAEGNYSNAVSCCVRFSL